MPPNPICGNPLLLEFLETWYQQALDQGNRTDTVYRKACTSMRNCPIVFNHPMETVCLQGIGPKIAQKLTEKLIAWHEERGLTPPPMVPYLKTKAPSLRQIKTTTTTHRATSSTTNSDQPRRTQLLDHDSDNELDPDALAALPDDVRRDVLNAIGNRANAGMGASKAISKTGATSRKRKANPGLAGASVSITDIADQEGDEGIEAPAAKRTRQPKEYVPRPRTGAYAVLRALTELNENARLTKEELIRAAQPYSDSSFTLSSNPGGIIGYTAWGSVKTLREHNLVKQQGRPARYSLTDHGRDTGERMLEVEAEMDLGAGNNGAVAASINTGTPRRRRANNDAITHFNFGDTTASSAAELGRLFSSQPFSIRNDVAPDIIDLDDNDEEAKQVNIHHIPRPPYNVLGNSSLASTSNVVKNQDAFNISNIPVSSINPKVAPSRTLPATDSVTPQALSNTDIYTHEIIYQPFPLKYLAAGTFEVHLILDNREVAMKSDRDYLQRQLSEIECNAITRPLDLGDVMWIAKGKLTDERGVQTNEEVELSLGYVAERKRLDDLVGSIKDGRFHEQKFRLQKFAGNVTYIIEAPANAIGKHPHMADAIQSAIFSTQVVNNFFVKLSPKLDDTIRYLARFTRLLQSTFSSKNLYMIPDTHLFPRNYTDLRQHLKTTKPSQEFYLTYAGLGNLASKSRSMTVRDVFLKMLMCTRGVSAEKALEIQRVFKTPRDFLLAFQEARRRGGDEEGKKLVMVKVDPHAATDRKKIKSALSTKLWEVWGKV